eukprot:7111960-Alexandrium_andersonii.AAC.1
MSASLVGSEMCIRDSREWAPVFAGSGGIPAAREHWRPLPVHRLVDVVGVCLLYTSDAADDM